jgi:hypothetical protein
MQLRPGWPMVVMAVARPEAGQLLESLSQSAHRRLTCTDEIADRPVGLIRYPDCCQFTGAVQLGKVDRVSPEVSEFLCARRFQSRPRLGK